MPVYEYHCSTCGKNFEATQRMSDAALTTCSCGATGTVQRLLSAGSGLIFKGSGFYITDYKNGGASSGASTSGSPAAAPSESAPAAAAAPAAADKPSGSCGSGGCPSC